VLFNSYGFIFLFVPIVAVGFFLFARIGTQWAATWLVAASYFFYAYWNPKYLILLLISIAINYEIGTAIAKRVADGRRATARTILVWGIVFDLALLGYFKYAGFFVENFAWLVDRHPTIAITLPLGISFFTFTQLAFLVDAFHGKVTRYNRIHYGLFVSYFPHLIAGPILHHHEMLPQFERKETYRFSYENMAVGGTIFFIGLFKKVILADGISVHVDPVFDAAAIGLPLSLVEAWGGVLSYALQLYFDFSGYSDMAIGVSRMFGIALPLNFYSPYKAASIIEFWQRWHMTLSRFLRDYLYIPLGGNRKGPSRRYVNLMLTMLLGGLWHGAGWTFVVWGGLHGAYLIVNHAWRALRVKLGQDPRQPLSAPWKAASVLVTFFCVTVAWAFFRAKDLPAAEAMIAGMFGRNGIGLSQSLLRDFGGAGEWLVAHGFGAPGVVDNFLVNSSTFAWVAVLMLVTWIAPNTHQLMNRYERVTNVPDIAGDRPPRFVWNPTMAAAALTCVIALAAIVNLNARSAFLYFQF